MKKGVKLLSIALVSAFLVGCGGSSSGKEDTVSLDLLREHFPPFETNATVSQVETDKRYRVSDDDVKTFRNKILSSYAYDNVTSLYSKDNAINNINANVSLAKFDINLTLVSNSNATFDAITEDNTYTELFGYIGGDVLNAHIYTTYNENISSQYDAYRNILASEEWGFTCDPRVGVWDCSKEVGDHLVYRWYTSGDYFYGYSAYKTKIP
jgi:hypothetical protein